MIPSRQYQGKKPFALHLSYVDTTITAFAMIYKCMQYVRYLFDTKNGIHVLLIFQQYLTHDIRAYFKFAYNTTDINIETKRLAVAYFFALIFVLISISILM